MGDKYEDLEPCHYETCGHCKINETSGENLYCEFCLVKKERFCESCWWNGIEAEKVGEWDCCYDCICQAFPVCPRCYSKIYDEYCTSCYHDLTHCNICYKFCDDLNSISICDDCIKNDKQKCVDFVMKILNS